MTGLKMSEIQGDKVMVFFQTNDAFQLRYVLTLVRVSDTGGDEMRLINRANAKQCPNWPFDQTWLERLRPAGKNEFNAKWKLALKTK
jgi:hypothetical protein